MKKFMLSVSMLLCLPLAAAAGEITAGSVPGNINYQGRLERDNAPITGTVHITFRIFNSPTATGGACGAPSQPCLWESPEIAVQAVQGIFSADMTPTLSLFGGGTKLYLEVQVEGDTLSPREPLNSVTYALVAKKLEDGSSVSVATLTAAYQVLLATTAGATVGVGTNSPSASAKMTVDGWLKLDSGGIIFPNNSSMSSSALGSADNIAAPVDATILADSDGNGSGDMVFSVLAGERARITNAGDMGLGTATPGGKLDVDGSIYVGNEGIYDRDDGEVNIMEDLGVAGGKVTGSNSESMSLGETNNVIALTSGGSERMRVHSNGYVGIGLAAPTANLHVSGDIRSNAGVRGGTVSIGTYAGGWTGASNEVRADNSTHLLLQQTNSYNVGIGTDTPREKLHVRGSVRSDYGIIAATGAFSGNVAVNGDFTANGNNKNVYLTTTTIYGSLTVTGGIGSTAGIPVYLNSTQTLTGQNTFLNQVVVSSDILTLNRLGSGVRDFDFSGSKYLQIGDNKPEFANDNAMAYLVGGSNADAKLNFYRGASEAARFETQGGLNLALVMNGKTKTLTDATYHRIQNSVVWISTGYNTTPAIFVSSYMGNVGIGTSVLDPNWRLTVDGNIRLTGSTSNSIIFADGSSMNTALAIGSALSLSNSGDALVQSDVDQFAGGDVVLRAGAVDGLILKSGGNVGIGTINPVSKLNIRGGDLVLGSPVNPYSGDSVEDLIVAGNVVFDGGLIQRSASQVQLSALMVALDVYLSTGTGNKTGIGTRSPVTTLDVNGNAQFGSGTTKSTFTAAGVLRLATQLGVPYGGTGATTLTSGGILYGAGTGAISALPVLTNGQLLIGDNSGAPAAATLTGTSNQVTVNTGAGTISLSLPQNIHTAADPAFNSLSLTTPLTVGNGGTGAASLAGVLKGNTAGAFTAMTGTANRVTRWSDTNTVAASGILTDNGTRFTVGAAMDVTGSLTTSSSGTFRANGASQYSVETASGILVNSGVINMTSGKIVNLAAPQYNSDAVNKSYVDNATGGGGAWGLLGNDVNDAVNFIGTTGAGDDLVFKTNFPPTEKMKITAAGVVQFTNALDLLYGGTGATSAAGARSNLGLGNIATQAANSVTITGGTITGITDLAVTDGGTGAGTPAGARTNLGLGSIATQDSTGVSITGGTITGITDLAVADGGTGAGTPAGARTNLGLGSGLSSTYTIATTTSTTGTPCQNWTFSNGILITVSAGFACP